MAKTDIWEVDKELMYFFRRTITDPSGRGSDTTESFNGDGTKTRFELAQPAFHHVQIGTADGSRIEEKYGSKYTIQYDMQYGAKTGTAAIIFGTAPNSGTNNVQIHYHYGSKGTWIYPDLPHERIALSDYPRIGMETVSSAMMQVGLGTGMTRSSMLKDIVVYAKNAKQLREIVNDVKDKLITNKDQFYYFTFIQPVGMGPVNKEPGRHEKVVSQNITTEIPFIFES